MRRVSSQATTSASRSAREHAQRDVLEVADRRRADDQPAASAAVGASPSERHAPPRRASPTRRRSAPARSAPGRATAAARARATSSRAGSSSRSPAAITPPPTTTTSGLKMLTSSRCPTPRRGPSRDDAARGRVAVVGQLGDQRAGDRPPAAARGRAPSRGRRGDARPRAPAPCPDATASRQPRLGSCRARRPVVVDRPCGRARRPRRCAPRTSRAVDDDPAADPGADRQQHRVGRVRARRRSAARRASRRSRRCRRTPAGRAARPSGRGTARRAIGRCTVVTATPRCAGRSATGCRSRRRRPRRRPHRWPRDRVDDRVEHLRGARCRAPSDGARWWTLQVRVDGAGEQLRAPEVDADHAARRPCRPPYPPPCPEPAPRSRRPYTMYRAAPASARRATAAARRPWTSSRRRRPARPAPRRPRGAAPGAPRPRQALVASGRVVKWIVLLAVGAWLAARPRPVPDQRADRARTRSPARPRPQLGGAGFPLDSANTILVLGSDARVKGSKEPGADSGAEPQRHDHADARRRRRTRRSSRSRATRSCDIPGHGRDKINAAYAFGGAALVDQDDQAVPRHRRSTTSSRSTSQRFPELIDAMGGIDYTGGCVVSKINGGSRNGGYTLRLRKGTHHIDGKQALALARTRHNLCNARENDLTRAKRQQKILAAMKLAADEPGRVHPAAVDLLERAQGAAQRHERPDAGGPLRRPGDRRLAADADPEADRRRDDARRRRRPASSVRRREAPRGAALPQGLVAFLAAALARAFGLGVRRLGLACRPPSSARPSCRRACRRPRWRTSRARAPCAWCRSRCCRSPCP